MFTINWSYYSQC